MAYTAYEDVRIEVYHGLYSKLKIQQSESLRFAPIETAESVLHQDKLGRLFHSLVEPGRSADEEFNITQDFFVARIIERKLQRFFAILIYAACSIPTIRTSIAVLVAGDTWPVKSRAGVDFCSLPARRDTLRELFQDDDIAADQFMGKQAYFCPIRIIKGQKTEIEDTEYHRLPYLEEQHLAEGSYGKVYKVKICTHHFYDPVNRSANLEPVVLARKDYIIMDIISNSVGECANILQNLGSLAFGSTKYSLFMPLAICDLRQYMMEHYEARPNNKADKADLVRCAIGLAGGLRFLHQDMRTSNMDGLVCYHLDLKPDNILIFQNGQAEKIWKISDFGMSRIKYKQQGQKGPTNLSTWFVRRPQTGDGSASGTQNLRGDGTYMAPESTLRGPDRPMTASSDVWSLGCVLSVLFAYLDDGKVGVESYARARSEHREALNLDSFFLHGGRKVHPVISKRHTLLIQNARARNHLEGKAVELALKYIEKSVLKADSSERSSARAAEEILRETFKIYTRLPDSPQTLTTETNAWSRYLPQSIWSRTSREDVIPHEGVGPWYLPGIEASKGCAISPNCSMVAHWTDRKISVYPWEPPSSSDRMNVQSFELETDKWLWKSIRLSKKYLIASTTSPTFVCYIFSLEGGDLHPPHIVEIIQPGISKFTISPDSHTLVCILKASQDDRKPGSLFVATIKELIARTSGGTSDTPAGEISHELSSSSIPLTAEPWSLGELKWSAAEVRHLSFSENDTIYFVVLPARRGQKTFVVHHVLRGHDMESMEIVPEGLDSSTVAPLFTTFCPFYQRSMTCAIVTREKQLHIRDMAIGETTRSIRKDIKKYRILRLMMGSRDDRMYALARESTSYRILLLRVTVPQSNGDQLSLTELAHLPGLSGDDQYSVKLNDIDSEKRILVAALVGDNKCAIYQVRLDETG
ncbi:hypothetical protein BJX99DRAFT_271288 [Aspergillus californicus]